MNARSPITVIPSEAEESSLKDTRPPTTHSRAGTLIPSAGVVIPSEAQ